MSKQMASSEKGTQVPQGKKQGQVSKLDGRALFKKWLKAAKKTSSPGVSVYTERSDKRSIGLSILRELLGDHFVGEETILKAGGYSKSAAIIANSLPTNKRVQSGDLGELLATEYLNSKTTFAVPIKKLRWKDDRETAMRGNDVIGVDNREKPIRVMKVECKSRAQFSKATVEEAATNLELHDGRPNPSTLAFITKRLYEEKRDDEAKVFQDLQSGGAISAENITHLIFAFAGNDPSSHLASCPKSKHRAIKRESAAIVVEDHGGFVAAVYGNHGTKP